MKVNGQDLSRASFQIPERIQDKKALQNKDHIEVSSLSGTIPTVSEEFLENLEQTKATLLSSPIPTALYRLSSARILEILSPSEGRPSLLNKEVHQKFMTDFLQESNRSAVQSSIDHPKISLLNHLLSQNSESSFENFS